MNKAPEGRPGMLSSSPVLLLVVTRGSRPVAPARSRQSEIAN